MAVDMLTLFERRMSYPHPDARDRLARLVGIDHHISKTDQEPRPARPSGRARAVGARVPSRRRQDHQFGADRGRRLSSSAAMSGRARPSLPRRSPTPSARAGGDRDRPASVEPVGARAGASRRDDAAYLRRVRLHGQGSEYDQKSKEGAEGAVILLVDEADALAQSRETVDLHHEEVSGVNAFIRGIDRLRTAASPPRSSCAPTATMRSTLR